MFLCVISCNGDSMKIKLFLFNLTLTLGAYGIIQILLPNMSSIYSHLFLPIFAPSYFFIPIIWMLLSILIGTAGYLLMIQPYLKRQHIIKVYLIQLCLLFLYPFIFFTLEAYLLAFLWSLSLWCITFYLLYELYEINEIASRLLIPYLLWLTFMCILTICIYYLN